MPEVRNRVLSTSETMSLLSLPPLHSLKLSSSSSTFLHGTAPFSLLLKPSATYPTSPPSFLPPIRAMKSMQGRVVCATNGKTVSVEVVRLAPHPKYKRRIRKKKKYQAHDEENKFKVGDIVALKESKPISKNKHFVALPVPPRNSSKKKKEGEGDIGIPLESQQQA